MLKITKTTTDEGATKGLRSAPKSSMKLRYEPHNEVGAVLAAAKVATREGASAYVYPGNSFMHRVYRVTLDKAEALNAINNDGNYIREITADLTVVRHDIER